jgi:methylglyoxal synthase
MGSVPSDSGNATEGISPKIGAIEPRNFADLVILNSNPLDDIAHASDIESVMKNGVIYPIDSLVNNLSANAASEPK